MVIMLDCLSRDPSSILGKVARSDIKVKLIRGGVIPLRPINNMEI